MSTPVSYPDSLDRERATYRMVSPTRGLDITGKLLHKNQYNGVLAYTVTVNGISKRKAVVVLPEDNLYEV